MRRARKITLMTPVTVWGSPAVVDRVQSLWPLVEFSVALRPQRPCGLSGTGSWSRTASSQSF